MMSKTDSGMIWRAVALLFTLYCFSSQSYAMTPLEEDELRDTAGQAAYYTTYTAPPTGLSGSGTSSADYGFFTLGLKADLAMNANIEHLQLGCGGVNGKGCDIDINALSLSGNPGVGSCAAGASRASCDAMLTNPFIQLAIKNPNSLSTRQLVGFRLSAQSSTGLLTAGQNTAKPNGINALSGYMPIAATSGTASTKPGVFGVGNSGGNETVNGYINANIALCTTGCGNNKPINSVPGQSQGINVATQTVPFNIPAFVINGSRQNSATVLANAIIPDIPISQNDGSLYINIQNQICVAFLICVANTKFYMNASLHGIGVNINFNEALGYIHNIPLSGNPFYLALQSTAVKYPGTASNDVAQTGWWMSFQNPVQLGALNPTNQVDITSAYPQLATFLGNYLKTNPVSITTGDGLSALFTGGITKDLGLINLSGNTANITLSNLQLNTQNVASNCYGGLKFC